ncbi:FixH family protein [Pseudothioclava arenosa]|uniref:Nitrogen fixation protein FixH n=1 Tax=Pseudothioclava arenosa TaxID=1795308 RepID=A0A2A4CV87_9RHOB|nr:FixH family protein [Pseudothioclava arenosa]PCD78046.1 nitrogen fixation protein FixH [Pseudothioclava arenosa]
MAKEINGKHVLGGFVGAFGLIIAVNIFMAYKAIGTFPGLETENSYVASQTFDADRAAQEALGWRVEPTYENGFLSLVIRDAQGLPARVSELKAVVGRTTFSGDDVEPEFAYKGGLFIAPLALEPGAWLIHLEATAADGTPFRKRLDFFVDG